MHTRIKTNIPDIPNNENNMNMKCYINSVCTYGLMSCSTGSTLLDTKGTCAPCMSDLVVVIIMIKLIYVLETIKNIDSTVAMLLVRLVHCDVVLLRDILQLRPKDLAQICERPKFHWPKFPL